MSPSLSHEQLYREYRDTVLSYISARVVPIEDAEDLCEEVFVKLFRLMESYDGSRASVSTLVYKLSHDTVIDHYRTHRRPAAISGQQELLPSAEDVIMDRERFADLAKALAKLPQQQRDILILRFYRGLTLKAIAEKTGLTYDTVVSRQKIALKAMKKMLEKE